MKHWSVIYTDSAKIDRNQLDNSVRTLVDKAIRKVSQNPLPKSEGGFGNPLGHRQGKNLTGLYKITLKKQGIRVVYELIRKGKTMQIVVIAARADDEVYSIASERVAR